MALIPRIEVTSVFAGSASAITRQQEFDYYRCNESFYEVSLKNVPQVCQKYINMASAEVFNGASRKLLMTKLIT